MNTCIDDPVWLAEQCATRPVRSIAEEIGCHVNTVKNRMRRFGLPGRGRSRPGETKSAETKAKMADARRAYWDAKPDRSDFRLKVSQAKTIHGRHPLGYVWAYTMEHGRILEHRLIAANVLGRPLLATEHVHHINGVVDDNRPENLQVLSHSEHASLHNTERDRDPSGKFTT